MKDTFCYKLRDLPIFIQFSDTSNQVPEMVFIGKLAFLQKDFSKFFERAELNKIHSLFLNKLNSDSVSDTKNIIESLKEENDKVGFYNTFRDARKLEETIDMVNNIQEKYRNYFREV